MEILLVHGAWHGAWCWADLERTLESRGVSSRSIDLPGHGARSDEAATWGGYVSAVGEALEKFAAPPLIVGHSMGGAVASGAAEAYPEKIGALVYLCAFRPIDGESVADLSQRAPPLKGFEFRPASAEVVVEPAVAASIFYHDCPAPERWSSQIQPQAIAPVQYKIRLTAGRYGTIPNYYIRCLRDRAIPPSLQTMMMERTPLHQSYDLETGHSPFAAAPDLLADILQGLCHSTLPRDLI